MRIGEPARKHGIPDDDILHAVRYASRQVDRGDGMVMLVGPARDGTPLEVGVLDIEGDDPVAIHAMPLRRKYYRFLS